MSLSTSTSRAHRASRRSAHARLTAVIGTASLTLPVLAATAPAHAEEGSPRSGDGAVMGQSFTGAAARGQAQVTGSVGWGITPAAEAAHGPYGIDTSGHTRITDWNVFTARSAQFAWIKATEGTYLKASSFNHQWTGATSQGMLRGAYHFAIPNGSSGAAQAEFFVRNKGGWSPDGRTLPGALDMEYNPYGPACYGKTKAQMNTWARSFINRYKQLTGVKPVIYTNADWWNTCVGSYDYSDVKLWLARYSSTPGAAPRSWSAHGATHTIWQTKPVEALGYDVNRVHGDRADLLRLARRG